MKKLKMWQWDFITLAIGLSILLFICFCVSEARAAFGLPSIIDTTWSFERAIISLPDPAGKFGDYFYVEGNVDSWKDFENSDMIQVRIDGVTYLTHSSNVILISE